MRNKPWKKLLVKPFNTYHIIRIAAANLHILILKKPSRQTAEIPLGTYIRTWSDNAVKSNLFCCFNKSDNIKHSVKTKLSRLRLVQIPAHIGFNSIKACKLQLCEPILPVFRQNTKIMHCT